MKTRLTVLSIAVSSLIGLTGCSGGGAGDPTSGQTPTPTPTPTPAPTPAPTVTLIAPSTATVGYPINVGWTSTNATSCSADFDSAHTGANEDQFSVTLNTAGPTTLTVTCTGDGGSTPASQVVAVSAAATAEGLWNGSTGSGNALAGVVTKEGDYWLAARDNSGNIIGFYAGHGTSTNTGPTTGTFASPGLVEATFAAGGAGSVKGGKIDPDADYVGKISIDGHFEPVPGGAFLGATGSLSASSALTGISSYSGTGTISLNGDGTVLTLSHTGTSTVLGANTMAMDYTDVITGTMSGGVFTATGGNTHLNSCQSISGSDFCSFASNPQENTFTSVTGGPLSLTNGASATFTGTYSSPAGATPVVYNISSLVVSVSPGLPPITADTFSLNTYDPAYEAAPALAALADNYTGAAGVGTTLDTTNASTLNVGSDGTFSGAEPATGCSYNGAATEHASGNVYDVTVTVSGCAAADSYSGVATFDATTDSLTIMALNVNRDHAFMFAGTGASH